MTSSPATIQRTATSEKNPTDSRASPIKTPETRHDPHSSRLRPSVDGTFLLDKERISPLFRFVIPIMPAEPQKPSLYERLGGIYSISCVVDDLIDRVMTDARLNANPAGNEAHHKVPPPGFKYLVTEMVGWASGGPQVYTGRPMRESHEHR